MISVLENANVLWGPTPTLALSSDHSSLARKIFNTIMICHDDMNYAIHACSNPIKRYSCLRRYFENLLVEPDEINKEISRAASISDKNMRAEALKIVPLALVLIGKGDTAIKFANDMSHQGLGEEAFKDISGPLALVGNIDKAIEVATQISDPNLRQEAFDYIFKALTLLGKIDAATEIARPISDENVRGKAFWYISKALAGAGKINEATEIALEISDESLKSHALEIIAAFQRL